MRNSHTSAKMQPDDEQQYPITKRAPIKSRGQEYAMSVTVR